MIHHIPVVAFRLAFSVLGCHVEAPALKTNPDPQWKFGGVCYCRITKPLLTHTVWNESGRRLGFEGCWI